MTSGNSLSRSKSFESHAGLVDSAVPIASYPMEIDYPVNGAPLGDHVNGAPWTGTNATILVPSNSTTPNDRTRHAQCTSGKRHAAPCCVKLKHATPGYGLFGDAMMIATQVLNPVSKQRRVVVIESFPNISD